MAELDLVVEEARAEFDALRGLISFVENGAEDNRPLPVQTRLVANDSAILFVAAAFEEAVRQLGVAYSEQLIQKAPIPEDRLRLIQVGLWERACSKLSSKPLGSRDFDEDVARANISVLSEFCLDLVELTLMVDHAVYNSRNLRTDEVNALFKRLGVTDVCGKAGRSTEFRNFFLVASVGQAQQEFPRYLNEFYRIRNTATHDLGIFRGMGAVDVVRHIDFFDLAVRRFAAVLEADLALIP